MLLLDKHSKKIFIKGRREIPNVKTVSHKAAGVWNGRKGHKY